MGPKTPQSLPEKFMFHKTLFQSKRIFLQMSIAILMVDTASCGSELIDTKLCGPGSGAESASGILP